METKREAKACALRGELDVIFATCGASHYSFQRMMEALHALPVDHLYVQHGPADPPPCASAVAYMRFEAIIEKIEMADVVVTHAGVGSILCAFQAGHTPIIFPRLKRYAEAVDDHQTELAEALGERGAALVARTPAELAAAVSSVPRRRAGGRIGSSALVHAVRSTITGVPLQLASQGSG